ncbi:uroporphyrinogen-III synthase [Cystobasidiomycetes sp. EMM_F5]
MPNHVLLVKEPKGRAENDPYTRELQPFYAASFLPALTHVLSNTEELQEIVRQGNHQRFAGVIATSQRAVEAWETAGRAVQAAPSLFWSTTPFYVVGPATAATVSRLPVHIRPTQDNIIGSSSGNAESLADLMCDQPSSAPNLPYLYLVGDKRRETLSRRLIKADRLVHELQVYETAPSPTFLRDLSRVIAAISPNSFDWIVFFSPSGAKLLLPLMHALPSSAKIAVIGPTTHDFVSKVPSFSVHATAQSPSPEALLSALRYFDDMCLPP